MTSSSQNPNIKSTHGGFDVRAGGDEKQKINFAWPKLTFMTHTNLSYLIGSYLQGATSIAGLTFRTNRGGREITYEHSESVRGFQV